MSQTNHSTPNDGGPRDPREPGDADIAKLTKHALHRKHGSLPTPSDLADEVLLRYVDGALSSGERETLESRLLLDPEARERIAILLGGLDDAHVSRRPIPTSEGILARGAQAVSRHVFHLAGGFIELLRGEGAMALQPAQSVRSASIGEARPAAFQIERLFQGALGTFPTRVELHAERATVAPALADLVVHVGKDQKAAEGVRCKLLRDGRPIDSREIEEHGCTFSRLGPGRYDIELRKGGIEIGRMQIDLRG